MNNSYELVKLENRILVLDKYKCRRICASMGMGPVSRLFRLLNYNMIHLKINESSTKHTIDI